VKHLPTIIVAVVFFGLGTVVGVIDRHSAEVTAKLEREAAEKKADVTPEEHFKLLHPLECSTWIANCTAGKVCKARYVCAADLTKRAPR
jgi:hypothetical protein